MTRFVVLAAIAALFLFASPTAAQADTFAPSRALMLIHKGLELAPSDRIELRFIPKFAPSGEVAPITYLGWKHRLNENLAVELYGGWAFQPDEPILSLSLDPKFDKFWGWSEVDLRPKSHDGYYFAQAERELTNWLSAGIEGEGWGNFGDSKTWSHGGGVNLILNLGQVVLDTAIHARIPEFSYDVGLQGLIRLHLFL